jgi:hypothetical protein
LLNRHFQYRSPEQIDVRFQTRAEIVRDGGYFAPQWEQDWPERAVQTMDHLSYWEDGRGIQNLKAMDRLTLFSWSLRSILSMAVKRTWDRLVLNRGSE